MLLQRVLFALLLLAAPTNGLVASGRGRVSPTRPPPVRSSAAMVAPSTVGWVGACVVGGVTGTPAVIRATTTWYRRIPLPDWTPPDRVFAPVWTTLYGLMGFAGSRVAGVLGMTSPPILHFCAHYVANVAWAPIFFGAQALRPALFLNFGLIASLAVLIKQYYAVSGVAALCLLPYMVWLLFATALNAEICKLNPSNGYNNAKWQADLARLQKAAADRAFA